MLSHTSSARGGPSLAVGRANSEVETELVRPRPPMSNDMLQAAEPAPGVRVHMHAAFGRWQIHFANSVAPAGKGLPLHPDLFRDAAFGDCLHRQHAMEPVTALRRMIRDSLCFSKGGVCS